MFSDSHGAPLGKQTELHGIYNFSMGSDSYIDIKRKIYFLIEQTTLDTIYLSADEHMLSPYREKYNNFDKSLFYTTRKDFATQLAYYKSEISQKIIYFQPKTGKVLRKYFLINLYKQFLTNNDQDDIKDLNWVKQTIEIKETRIKKRINTQFNFEENSKTLKQILLDIINICKTNDVVIIGVKFPVTKEYYSMTKDKDFGVETIFRDCNIRVLDFQSNFKDKEDLFYNEDHLTPEGGKSFADVLFKELRGIKKD